MPRLSSRHATLLLLCAIALDARAQAAPPRDAATTSCDGRAIRAINVNPQRPPFQGSAAYWRRFARLFGLHHATTDSAVVRRFLALRTGGPCTAFRLRESERLLRAQPYLADAKVRSVPVDSAGVRVEVETVDEIAAIGALSLSGTHVSALEIGNENMFGQAWLLAVHGTDRPLEGKAAGFRAKDYQFLGRPYTFDVEAEGGQRTSSFQLGAGHAYLTDLQRIAWETAIAHADRSFVVVRRGRDVDDLAVRYRRLAADVGGVLRLRGIQRPILLGGVATVTRLDPTGVFAVTDTGVAPDTALANRYTKVRQVRFAGVGAWRALRFITVRGFDALTGPQDVATGIQLFGEAGRGVRPFGGDNDLFLQGDVLAGVGGPTRYGGLHALIEARRNSERASWDGVIASARLASYWKPRPAALLRLWADGAGGWRVRVPFQLQLATDERRIGGYPATQFGGRRAGTGIEARHLVPVPPRLAGRTDLGLSVFAEAGRLFAGDAPYGSSTAILPSVGVGVLAAVPAGSKRVGRLDVSFPLGSVRAPNRRGIELRFSFSDATGILRRESGDVASAREQIVGTNIFLP
jgi:hypothetical protein